MRPLQHTPATLCGGATLLALLTLLNGGCRQEEPPVHDAQDPTSYVQLTLTRASANREVADEVARLEAAGLTLEHAHQLGWEAQATLASDDFLEEFRAEFARTVYQATHEVYPQEAFRWKPRQIEAALQLRQSHEEYLTKFRRYLQQPAPSFGFDLRKGLLANTALVDVVRAAHRLEALEAAVLLERGKVNLAIDRLAAMLLISARLDDIPHVVPRLAAAELREETAEVFQAIANHASRDQRTRQRLADLVSAQLTAWPSDAHTWRGERAVGLHTYEMVRDGQLLSLLTDQQLEQLKQRGPLRQVANIIAHQLEADQAYYLAAMRELIDACEGPYAERQAVLARVEQHLADTAHTPNFPYVAGTLLLEQMPEGNRRMVADLAVWRALGLLVGVKEESASLNPLTGESFEVINEGGSRSIELKGDPHERTLRIMRG